MHMRSHARVNSTTATNAAKAGPSNERSVKRKLSATNDGRNPTRKSKLMDPRTANRYQYTLVNLYWLHVFFYVSYFYYYRENTIRKPNLLGQAGGVA